MKKIIFNSSRKKCWAQEIKRCRNEYFFSLVSPYLVDPWLIFLVNFPSNNPYDICEFLIVTVGSLTCSASAITLNCITILSMSLSHTLSWKLSMHLPSNQSRKIQLMLWLRLLIRFALLVNIPTYSWPFLACDFFEEQSMTKCL